MTTRSLLKPILITVCASTLLGACGNTPEATSGNIVRQDPESKSAVVAHFAMLAHANYQDTLTTAQALDKTTDALIATPTPQTLTAAKEAWLNARVLYQQTEVFRFGNAVVEDWEGQLNALPLDEGLIDYIIVMAISTNSATLVPPPI
ncbi:imelysin family protein [Marinobacter caseinilyticus]|uniref:imelysin family protein n=1 Tax=Marinobacter caseinilyticus TaxID=2692195 RepID=UPI003D0629BC